MVYECWIGVSVCMSAYMILRHVSGVWSVDEGWVWDVLACMLACGCNYLACECWMVLSCVGPVYVALRIRVTCMHISVHVYMCLVFGMWMSKECEYGMRVFACMSAFKYACVLRV